MHFGPGRISAVTSWTPKSKSIACRLTVCGREEHFLQPVLMQVSESKRHITQLDRPIRANPDLMIFLNAGCLRSQGRRRVLREVRSFIGIDD